VSPVDLVAVTVARIDEIATRLVGPDGERCSTCNGYGDVVAFDHRFGGWSEFECTACEGAGVRSK
jgi:DnaJ-class molecular chaperone